jgi:hypothetical protein
MKYRTLLIVAVAFLFASVAGCASSGDHEHHWAVGKWKLEMTVAEHHEHHEHHQEEKVLKGKLRFEREEHHWEGKISLDGSDKWERLEDIHVSDDDIRFSRPERHQMFRGHRSGDDIKGTWKSEEGKEREGRWKADRD